MVAELFEKEGVNKRRSLFSVKQVCVLVIYLKMFIFIDQLLIEFIVRCLLITCSLAKIHIQGHCRAKCICQILLKSSRICHRAVIQACNCLNFSQRFSLKVLSGQPPGIPQKFPSRPPKLGRITSPKYLCEYVSPNGVMISGLLI